MGELVSFDAVKAERKLRERQSRAIAHCVAYLIAVVGPVETPDDLQAFRELVTEMAAQDELFHHDIIITEARG